MKKYVVGVDIGGTTVKVGVFTLEGELRAKWEVPTRKKDHGKNILPDVAASLKTVLPDMGIKLDEVEGIGMGVPGPVMPDKSVEVCVNLGWGNCTPAKEMSELMGGIPCDCDNDANVAALGEMWMGGGMGYQNLVAITLGTGVGGGVVLNGKIVNGSHGLGGEVGHMHIREEEKLVCNCGGTGCLEQVSSATGFAREAVRVMQSSDKPSKMRDFGEAITAKDVFDLAKEGDELAVETVETCCRYLGWAIALITHVIDPEVFVIGGGVSKAGDFLIDVLKKYYDSYMHVGKKYAELKLASLGNDAGIYGAAKLVLK